MTETPAAAKWWGTVLAVQANYYRVQLYPELNAPAPELLCTRRSRLKKVGQQVMVGDRVVVEEPDWQGQRAAIAQVLARETQLTRPPVANANQLLLVFALDDPPLDPYQLSRFLVTGEITHLNIALCLSKADLVSQEQQQYWQERLQQWGYHPLLISLYAGEGLAALRQQCRDQLTVVSGPSGVGKSSLINDLIPDADLRVNAVSQWGRGRHTTRHVELFELPTGGLLADSPGFNQPALDCPPEELADHFPEARQRLAQGSCQFNNCLHRDEPNCVVRGDWERYPHYLDFLAEVTALQEQVQATSDPESTLKLKSKGNGKTQYEPKLETKKYRRPSRRTQQQALQELYKDKDLL